MRRIIAALLLSLALASPAQAELTPTEKAEVREIATALEHLTTVWIHFGRALLYRTTANQTALNNVWASVMPLQTDLIRAYALLLHVNPAAPGDTSTFNTYEAMGRAAWVSEAVSKLGTSSSAITATQSLISTAQGVVGQNAEYYGGLTDMSTFLTTMAGDIAGFNAGLTYLTPRGTLWFPQVVSPHGTFIDSTRFLFSAMQEMTLAMSTMRLVFHAAAQGEAALPDTTNVAFLRLTFAGAELMEKFESVLHSWVNIPRLNHCQFSPHHFMARIVERLTQISSESTSATTPFRGGEFAGAPYRFHMASTFNIDFLEPLRIPLETRPLTWQKFNLTLTHWLHSWQGSDGAVWRLMEFPQGVTIASLRAQAGRTNDANVPPICPDTIAPTVTLLYPAHGQKIGGRQTISAECRDSIGTPGGIAGGAEGEIGTLCAKMDVKIDGATVATVVTPPYEYRWDTALSTNGGHTVQAVGYDAAGNTTSTATHTVTVGN